MTALLAAFCVGVPIAAFAAASWAGALIAEGVLVLTLACAGMTARWVLNRRRLAAWEADWSVTGPRWTSKR